MTERIDGDTEDTDDEEETKDAAEEVGAGALGVGYWAIFELGGGLGGLVEFLIFHLNNKFNYDLVTAIHGESGDRVDDCQNHPQPEEAAAVAHQLGRRPEPHRDAGQPGQGQRFQHE